jgi:CHAT domain-containing protein
MARKRRVFFHTVQSFLRWSLALLLTLTIIVVGVNHNSTVAKSINVVEQGKADYDAGRFTEAVKMLQQAAAEFTGRGDYVNAAIAQINLSLAYQQLGKWREAEAAINSSLKLLTSSKYAQVLGQALDVQGKLQLSQGKSEAALLTWKQAADIYQQIGDQPSLTRNRINSAQALQAMGLYRRAEKYLTQVQQTLVSLPDSEVKAIGLRSLGNVHRVVGDLNISQLVLTKSLETAQAIKSNSAISEATLSLGNTALAQSKAQLALGNQAEAEKKIQTALRLYQQAAADKQPTTRTQALLNQLSLLVLKKQYANALTLSSQIKAEIDRLPVSRGTVYSRVNFAQTLMQLRKEDIDISSLDIAKLLSLAVKQAISLQDKRAESYALGSLGELYEQTGQISEALQLTKQALVIAETLQPADIAYQWEWQLGRLLKKQGNIPEATVAYNVAFKTLKNLRGDLVAINADVQYSFTESVEPVYREFVQLLLQAQGKTIDKNNLTQARDVIESLQLAELDDFFRSPCVEQSIEVDKILSQDQKAAFIYPIILPNSLEVILTLPSQEIYHYNTVVAQKKVVSTIAALRENLLDVTGKFQVKQQSQQLYDWLIKPLEAELIENDIQTLVFVLDGELRNIPMGVLYDKQQYLIQKYAIALTPGLQLINPKPLQKVELNALTAGVNQERFGFPPLQNVTRELKEIQLEIPKTRQLLNQKFTETNLLKQLQTSTFSVVHLATHGEFSSDPTKTFILTWDGLMKVKDFDKLLRDSNYTNNKSIELLVLSACKTAQGDKRAALGLAGVAVRAGARSTLASLWSVDDPATADFMSEFYRQIKTGVTKAQALQSAQLAIFAKEDNPYYWAPYVLLGNWL